MHETAAARRQETGRDRWGGLVPAHTPVHCGVGRAVPVAGRPLGEVEIVGVVVEQPRDTGAVLLAEFPHPMERIIVVDLFQVLDGPPDRPRSVVGETRPYRRKRHRRPGAARHQEEPPPRLRPSHGVGGEHAGLDAVTGSLQQVAGRFHDPAAVVLDRGHILDEHHPRPRGNRERRNREIEMVPPVVPTGVVVQVRVPFTWRTGNYQVHAANRLAQLGVEEFRLIDELGPVRPPPHPVVQQVGHRLPGDPPHRVVPRIHLSRAVVAVRDEFPDRLETGLIAQLANPERESSRPAEQVGDAQSLPGGIRCDRSAAPKIGAPPLALRIAATDALPFFQIGAQAPPGAERQGVPDNPVVPIVLAKGFVRGDDAGLPRSRGEVHCSAFRRSNFARRSRMKVSASSSS